MLHIPDAAVHVPPVQEGEVREFPSNRDVLGLAREWRREKSRRPFSEAVCLTHSVTNTGGLFQSPSSVEAMGRPEWWRESQSTSGGTPGCSLSRCSTSSI